MAERQGFLHADDTEAAMVIIVQVRAADAAGGHADEDFARLRRCRWQRDVLNPKVMRRVDDDGFHGSLTERPSCRRRHR